MSYVDLWQIIKAKIELSKAAADEIRARRRRGALPFISDTRSAEFLNPRQRSIYDKLRRALPMENLEIGITEEVIEGWTVFLTGDDEEQLDAKLKKTKGMIRRDIDEFGACRLFVVPLNSKHVGLKLCFDRGLRCVHVTKSNAGRRGGD